MCKLGYRDNRRLSIRERVCAHLSQESLRTTMPLLCLCHPNPRWLGCVWVSKLCLSDIPPSRKTCFSFFLLMLPHLLSTFQEFVIDVYESPCLFHGAISSLFLFRIYHPLLCFQSLVRRKVPSDSIINKKLVILKISVSFSLRVLWCIYK